MNVVEWLAERAREAGASTESSTDRDGAFSYHAETHAFAVGYADGIASISPTPPAGRTNADAVDEPSYYKGGYAAGTLSQAVTVVAVAATLRRSGR